MQTFYADFSSIDSREFLKKPNNKLLNLRRMMFGAIIPAIMIVLPMKSSVIDSGDGFWEAVRNLETPQEKDLDMEHKGFGEAVSVMAAGDFARAESLFTMMRDASDSLVAQESQALLHDIWLYRSRWDKLKEDTDEGIEEGSDEGNEEGPGLYDVYAELPPRVFTFPQSRQTIPLERSVSGSPVVEVTVNGKKHKFWLDTGAQGTVISSNTAQDCSVTPLIESGVKAMGATSQTVPVSPAALDSLVIAGIKITNQPVSIMDSKNLTLMGGQIVIEGIIGWDILKHLVIEIDSGAITLYEPLIAEGRDRNLIWFTVPLVKCRYDSGTPVYFVLDTGAGRTGLFESAFDRLEIKNFRTDTLTVGAVGGSQKIEVKIVPEVRLALDGTEFEFKDVKAMPELRRKGSFVNAVGILGADAFSAGHCIKVDMTNGVFEVK